MQLGRVPHVRGLVLAAGAGRRMGGPKALVRKTAGAPTLVEEAITALLDGGCEGVTVVVGAAAAEVTDVIRHLGRDVDVVECAEWDEGMGATLRTGLASLTSATHEHAAPVSAALITLVDLPDVGAEVVARLLASGPRPSPVHGGPPALATRPDGPGKAHETTSEEQAVGEEADEAARWRATLSRAAYAGVPGHPVVIGRDHWDEVIASAVGDRGARSHFRAHAHGLVECGDLASGRDADRPEDLTPQGP
ncbi:4-diphosphocytidyl-2C-methyl-D-erythritol synthase [Intrasporangium oryzae NRRL B-24470]|uniref:4-diphosphocytidyl-2C-methyl-D-erythritol synthase n=2 Tax=Intrasporangium TaxID=53357 RepID=W9GBT9_9MICO|nr:4-diphosphocytidyl-2C-methyl-D-erythritol synthase [Intrasporangium oryzae NRRL B-24470]